LRYEIWSNGGFLRFEGNVYLKHHWFRSCSRIIITTRDKLW